MAVLQRFPDFGSVIAVSHDAMEKSEHVHEVKPESAIEAPGVEVFGHRGVMSFHHHQPLTSKTFHDPFPSGVPVCLFTFSISGSGRLLAPRFRGGKSSPVP